MRLSTLILPIYAWPDARSVWIRAEQFGFHCAYTYDHLSWRSFRDKPWYGTIPTLTAAATATETIRLGTMVTNPNFRHPVTLAKDLMTLDEISRGRITLGIGAGTDGFDATALGNAPWSRRERAERFDEFVPLLSKLLKHDATTSVGSYYSAVEARNIPGCVQKPRIPFYVAATGPRGLRLTVQYGQGWATDLDAMSVGDISLEEGLRDLKVRLDTLSAACDSARRDVAELDKILLHSSSPRYPFTSVEAFVDWASRHAELGVTELVLPWPVPDSVFASDAALFERIAVEGMPKLHQSLASTDNGG
jgi:alkanesulfonate monooxygenase SsuD/methylene tetrahydromethanopterin reductase-like flavin-dependent oxidoreductase (luciferase family)